MSLDDLNSWLISDGIREDVDILTRLTVRTELDNITAEPSKDTPKLNWPHLLLAGSILARSELRAHQETALRIATGAVTLANSQPIKDAGAVLLDKLSNSRAINLAHDRKLLVTDLDSVVTSY